MRFLFTMAVLLAILGSLCLGYNWLAFQRVNYRAVGILIAAALFAVIYFAAFLRHRAVTNRQIVGRLR
jgi:hypothetical protein